MTFGHDSILSLKLFQSLLAVTFWTLSSAGVALARRRSKLIQEQDLTFKFISVVPNSNEKCLNIRAALRKKYKSWHIFRNQFNLTAQFSILIAIFLRVESVECF